MFDTLEKRAWLRGFVDELTKSGQEKPPILENVFPRIKGGVDLLGNLPLLIGGAGGLLGAQKGQGWRGLGHGALRGTVTGLGAAAGGSIGEGLGNLIFGDPMAAGLGQIIGAGLGGYGGYQTGGDILKGLYGKEQEEGIFGKDRPVSVPGKIKPV